MEEEQNFQQMQEQPNKSKAWIWILIILIILFIGVGIYFWLSGGNLSAGIGGNSIPQPPALPN